MSTSGIARATRVERAIERLEAAVVRLDDALDAAPAGGGEAADELRRENGDLKALNREAAETLGGAIARLEGLVGVDKAS